MKEQPILIPTVKISPRKSSIYNQVYYPNNIRPRRKIEFDNDGNKIKKPYLNNNTQYHLSNHSTKKIESKISWLYSISHPVTGYNYKSDNDFKFRLCFVTLTLSSKQVHDDVTLKEQLLNQLFTELRKKYAISDYVWKLEKQRNGNTHYHIVTNKWIPWQELRDMWNRIQNKLGYVDRYTESMQRYHSGGFKVNNKLLPKWSLSEQYTAYVNGTKSKWRNPNSVDIHSLSRIKDITKYITKYITKEPMKDEVQLQLLIENGVLYGRLWGCSQSLSKLDGVRIEITSDVEEELKLLANHKNTKIYEHDYGTLLLCSYEVFRELNLHILLYYFSSYLATFGLTPV